MATHKKEKFLIYTEAQNSLEIEGLQANRHLPNTQTSVKVADKFYLQH